MGATTPPNDSHEFKTEQKKTNKNTTFTKQQLERELRSDALVTRDRGYLLKESRLQVGLAKADAACHLSRRKTYASTSRQVKEPPPTAHATGALTRKNEESVGDHPPPLPLPHWLICRWCSKNLIPRTTHFFGRAKNSRFQNSVIGFFCSLSIWFLRSDASVVICRFLFKVVIYDGPDS